MAGRVQRQQSLPLLAVVGCATGRIFKWSKRPFYCWDTAACYADTANALAAVDVHASAGIKNVLLGAGRWQTAGSGSGRRRGTRIGGATGTGTGRQAAAA